MIQSYLSSDGTRILAKYDEKKMLSEFARYIVKKEQPISMAYYTDFAHRIMENMHGDSPLSPIIEVMRDKFLKY
jgi:hypothetical protein